MLRRIAIPLAGILATCSLLVAATAQAYISVEPDCPAPTTPSPFPRVVQRCNASRYR